MVDAYTHIQEKEKFVLQTGKLEKNERWQKSTRYT
jgi:hypothetical protein